MSRPVITDFGTILRNLRVNAGITQRSIAEYIQKSTSYIANVEGNTTSAPRKEVLLEWLKCLGAEQRFEELNQLAHLNKTQVSAKLRPNDTINPKLVALIDKYKTNTLTTLDRNLLSCIDD